MLTAEMPEKMRLMVTLASWCAPAAALIAKLLGLLGLSPLAERGLSFTPTDDGTNPFAG